MNMVTSHENSVHEYCDIRVSQSAIDLTVVLESFTQMCRSTTLPLKLWSLVTWTSKSSEFPYKTTWSQLEVTQNYVRKQEHKMTSFSLQSKKKKMTSSCTLDTNNDCLPASLKYPRNVLESGKGNLPTSQLQMNHKYPYCE